MSFRCPGLSRGDITAKMVTCPACESPVEMFSDEHSIRCPRCKTKITTEPEASCKKWCSGCMGQRRVRDEKDS